MDGVLPLRDPAARPAKLLPGESGSPLAAVDIAWLRMDDPTNLMHVQGVLPLSGEVSWEEAAEVFEQRLVKIPRFRQRIADDDGRLVWVDDATFDVRRHLREERIAEPGDDAALAAAIERHLERDFDFAHPLWEFHLLQGHREGSVLFAKVHHVIGDGIALVTVILALTDLDRRGPATTEIPGDLDSDSANPFFDILMRRGEPAFEVARQAAERWMPEMVRLMLAPLEAYRRVHPVIRGTAASGALARLLALPADPPTPFKGALGRSKRVAWTEQVPLDDVKAVGKAHGGTVNDVLNAAMVGGLRRYLERDGRPDESLAVRAAMPVSLRPLDEMADLGNRFGLVFLKLPVGVEDPHRRLALLRSSTAALKRSTEPLVVLALLRAMGALPEWVHRAMLAIFQRKATAVFTNVPGPRQTLWFAGHSIRDLFFWVPQAGRVGLGVSILSYNGQVRMGVGTDAGLIPDPQRIVDGFHAEFEALQRAPG